MKNIKKNIAFFLTFLMIVSMLPVGSVKAQEAVYPEAVENLSGENNSPLESQEEKESGESSGNEDVQADEPDAVSENDGAQAGESDTVSGNDDSQADESNAVSENDDSQADEFDEVSENEGAQTDENCETISENNPDTDRSNMASMPAEIMAADSSGFVTEKKGNEVILKDYTGTATDLMIPNNVTQIADRFLYGNTKITSVTFSSSIKSVGNNAFYNCTSLAEVKLNENLKTIGGGAFCGAAFGSVLDTGAVEYAGLEIPGTVQSIGAGAFRNSKYLKEVTFKDGGTVELTIESSYGFNTFGNCESLETVYLPKKLKAIPDYMFYGCTALKETMIPEGPTAIGNNAFYNCTSLKEIEIPASVEEIGSNAFYNCTSLTEAKLNEGLKTIGGGAFCGAAFGSVLDTGAVEYAGLEIPGTVQSIGAGAFRSSKYLKDVTFKDGRTVVLTIESSYGFNTFGNCESLETVYLPKRLDAIPDYMFYGCTALKEAMIPEGPTAIGNNAFYNCTSLKEIEIPASVEGVGSNAFYNCTSLTEAKLNEGLKTIGGGAFYGAAFGSVLDTGAVEYVGLEIPSTVQNIGAGAFRSSKYLKDVTFKDGRTVVLTIESSYGFNTFGNCESLETVYLPKRLDAIPDYMFYGCTALKNVYIPENVKTVGNYVMNNCTNVTIYGKSGSYAQTWTAAKADKGFTFVDISGVDKTVTAVSLDRNSIALSGKEAVGKTIALVAAVTPAYAENVEYAFTSDNESVATVVQDGTTAQAATVTITGYGSAKITVTADGKTDECVITVSKEAIGKITSPENNTVFKQGGTAAVVLTAKVEDTDSTTKVTFMVKSAKLQKILEAKNSGKDDIWTAELSANEIDGFGDGKGTIRLLVDGKEMDLVRITFETAGSSGDSGETGDDEEIPPADIEEMEDDGKAEPAPPVLEEKRKEGLWIWEEKLNEKAYQYTGEAVTPPVYVYDGETRLREGQDYTVKYSNNMKAADITKVDPQKAPAVTVTGKGRYTGTKKAYFTIRQTDIREAAAMPYVVANAAKPPVPELWYKGIKLVNKRDFTYTYENNIVTVTAKEGGNFKGTKSFEGIPAAMAKKPVSIKKAKIPQEEFQKTFVYSGKACTQNCRLTIDGTTLEKGRDYTVRYQKNIKAGTASVTYYGRGLYTGKLKKTYKIQAYDIHEDTGHKIKVEGAECYYAKGGSRLKPTVTFDGEVLKEGADYTLSYKKNKQVGTNTATCVITGKGSFKGKIQHGFTIKKQELSKMTLVSSCPVYKDKANNYKVTVKLMDEDGKLLSANKDFGKDCVYEHINTAGTAETLQDKDTVSAGTKIRITIKAVESGPYTGEFTDEYTVLSQSIASAKVTIPPQPYTGEEIKPFEEKATGIKVSIGRTPLSENDYEIVGYKNNVDKGTATVILRGKGNYGGTKTARFKITAKPWR